MAPLAGECAPRTGEPRPEPLSSGQVRKLGGVGVSRLVNPTWHLTCQTLVRESLGLSGQVGCIYLAPNLPFGKKFKESTLFLVHLSMVPTVLIAEVSHGYWERPSDAGQPLGRFRRDHSGEEPGTAARGPGTPRASPGTGHAWSLPPVLACASPSLPVCSSSWVPISRLLASACPGAGLWAAQPISAPRSVWGKAVATPSARWFLNQSSGRPGLTRLEAVRNGTDSTWDSVSLFFRVVCFSLPDVSAGGFRDMPAPGNPTLSSVPIRLGACRSQQAPPQLRVRGTEMKSAAGGAWA